MPTSSPQIQSSSVAAAFDSYPSRARSGLLHLRRLIFEMAAELDGVGPIEETLKWGQPAYLTSTTGSGSTVRVAPTRQPSDHDYGMFFICTTNLVATFKRMFGDVFDYDGDRALLFRVGGDLPTAELKECIAMALTYHLAPQAPQGSN